MYFNLTKLGSICKLWPKQFYKIDPSSNNNNDYSELLYSHLLDAEGHRLTYTHFTAKVSRNSMIEIIFNRSEFSLTKN
jgi:hypothetical protein